MSTFQSSILHTINSAIIVIAGAALLITGHIDATSGVALIAAAGGISMGVGAVSIGASSSQPTTPAGNASNGVSTAPTQQGAQGVAPAQGAQGANVATVQS